MTVSADYITLQRAIADDLGDYTELLAPLSDSNLADSPIKRAIQSAIAKWETELFWFTETRDTTLFTTVSGQEFYTNADAAAIATSPEIEGLYAIIGVIRRPLDRRSWEYMEEQSTDPVFRGPPYDWAYFGQQLRFYPIPDQAYPIIANRTQRIAPLVADSDSNVWTTFAYDLIRCEAKMILARDTLHDDEIVSRMQAAIYGNPALGERGFLSVLKGETMRRGRSRIKPTPF